MPESLGYDIEAARRAVPLTERVVYLNTGSEGLVARPVEDKVIEDTRLYDEEGFNSRHILEEKTETARTRIANLIGVTDDEIGFTDNASHSVAIVASGLPWQEGDEVLMSDEEHPALLLNFYWLETRFGVKVNRFKLSSDPEVVLADLKAKVTPRTKLIATSQVAALTGTRVPVKEVCDFGREHGVLTLIDGAQAVMSIPVHVPDFNPDFYISNGHKWIHGPKGTGILYVRKDNLDKVLPLQLGTGAAAYPLPNGTEVVLHPSARRYEYATRHNAAFAGLTYALDWLESLGVENIMRHAKELTGYGKERTKALKGARLHTPDPWDESSAMFGFSIDDVDGVDLREWLRWNKNILARRVLEFQGLRVAVAYFTTKEELDLFFDTIPEYPKWPHGR